MNKVWHTFTVKQEVLEASSARTCQSSPFLSRERSTEQSGRTAQLPTQMKTKTNFEALPIDLKIDCRHQKRGADPAVREAPSFSRPDRLPRAWWVNWAPSSVMSSYWTPTAAHWKRWHLSSGPWSSACAALHYPGAISIKFLTNWCVWCDLRPFQSIWFVAFQAPFVP